MPKLSIKATIAQDFVTAGDDLSGKIWINPGSGFGSKLSSLVIEGLIVTAQCNVRVDWQEDRDIRRRGTAWVYCVEKQLLDAPLEVSGPKIFDFRIDIPNFVQRSATSWNPSSTFNCIAGHDIPPSQPGLVAHVLQIEVKRGGRFRGYSQLLELPYSLVMTRSARQPDIHLQTDARTFVHRPHRQRRQTLAHSPATLEELDRVGTSPGCKYTAKARIPLAVYDGGPLPINLTVESSGDSPQSSSNNNLTSDVLLKAVTVNIKSLSHFRVKLAENTKFIDPETDTCCPASHCLKSVASLSQPLRGSVRLDELMGGLRLKAPQGLPTFRTYNAARTYQLEVNVVVGIEKASYELDFRRNIHIDPGHYKAPAGTASNATSDSSPDEEVAEESFLPRYSTPPPAYVESANSISLTQGADAGVP